MNADGRLGPSAALRASRFLRGMEVVLSPSAAQGSGQAEGTRTVVSGGTRMFAAVDSRAAQGGVPVQQQPHGELARNARSQAPLHLLSRNIGGGAQQSVSTKDESELESCLHIE